MSVKVINPFTLEPITTLPFTTDQEIEKTLDTAFQLWKTKSYISKVKRLEVLEKTSNYIKANSNAIATLATTEGGKALKDSIIEVERAAIGVDTAIQVLRSSVGEMIPMGHTKSSENRIAFSIQEAIGPILAISAFNHPFNLIVHQVIPAIVAGAPIVIKPASTTPLSCKKLIEILYQAGLPESHAKMILCSREKAEALVSDSRFRFFSFVGSAKVGWNLKQKLKPYVHTSMEHGGVAPAILCKDAEIDTILPSLIKAGYYHAGQVCVSLQKLIIHKDIYEEVKEKFLRLAKAQSVGNPLSKDTDYGPMIQLEEKQRVLQWLQEVKTHILLGGEEVHTTCITPTVIEAPALSAKVSQMEVFAPVVSIYPFSEIKEALQIANSEQHSFQSSIYTRDIDRALTFSRELDASTVLVNDHPAYRVDWMPFGGKNNSGFGWGGIPYTIHDYTVQKRIIIQSKEITN